MGSSNRSLRSWIRGRKPIFGVVHLDPLPGSARGGRSAEKVLARALADAAVYRDGGLDGVVVENFGDAPFRAGRVDAIVACVLTRVVSAVVELHAGWKVGVNVLRNDAVTALAVAAASGADFVRVNVLTGVAVTDQGLVAGEAEAVCRARSAFAPRVTLFADHRVKHARPLVERPVEVEVRELVERAGADVVLVTGDETGSPPGAETVARVAAAARPAPVLVASGVRPDNAAELLAVADGAVVGTGLKRGGRTAARPDPRRIESLLAAVAPVR